MSLPANATLEQIATPGPRAPNGDPGAPVPAWSGSVPAYLTTRERVTRTARELEEIERQEVLVVALRALRAAGAPVPAPGADWEADSVLVGDRRVTPPIQKRYTVDALTLRAAGTPVDDLLLALSDPRAP